MNKGCECITSGSSFEIIEVSGKSNDIPHFIVLYKLDGEVIRYKAYIENNYCLEKLDDTSLHNVDNYEDLLSSLHGTLYHPIYDRSIEQYTHSNWKDILINWNEDNPTYIVDVELPIPKYYIDYSKEVIDEGYEYELYIDEEGEDTSVPHFHVRFKNNYNKYGKIDTAICFDGPYFYSHNNPNNKYNNKDFIIGNGFREYGYNISEFVTDLDFDYWSRLIDSWNCNHPNNMVDKDLYVPDYNLDMRWRSWINNGDDLIILQ